MSDKTGPRIDSLLVAQRELVAALQDPARYPHPVEAIRLIETHISFVLLTGTFAYKIKKAVDLGFVDYTRLEQRRFFCDEELRLNRRLAPQLYLAAIPIYGSAQDPRFDNGDVPIEWAVKMAEFDQNDQLDHLVARKGLSPDQIDALAAMLAHFHTTAPRAGPATPYGDPATIWEPVETNFAHFRAHAGAHRTQIAELESWCAGEFNRLRQGFIRRKAAGFVREGHGDLHLGNIVLADGAPLVFDCIEFNSELRWIDIVCDLAFLVMDLSAHGHTDSAWRLLNGWQEATGDYAGLALLPFYQVYRALVRAKVAHLRALDDTTDPVEREAGQARMAAYLDYACSIMSPLPRALLITHGFSGSGKSTLARAVAESLGTVCLRSDVERKRLHGLAPLASSGSAIDAGLYLESATVATYEHLAILAGFVLGAGYPVMVDAACLQGWQRNCFRDLARQRGVPFLILECIAAPEILQQRIATRSDDPSEASAAVLARQYQRAEPLNEEERSEVLTIDTRRENFDAIVTEIRQRIQYTS